MKRRRYHLRNGKNKYIQRITKRYFALLLAFFMIISCSPVYAAEGTGKTGDRLRNSGGSLQYPGIMLKIMTVDNMARSDAGKAKVTELLSGKTKISLVDSVTVEKDKNLKKVYTAWLHVEYEYHGEQKEIETTAAGEFLNYSKSKRSDVYNNL